ncbi:type II toxin-antitoxin system YoeB family toxin [Furfurilactobacillus rossiae]|nr:type II toxin-antitoxin system YoeB family toxin [Furfurilactobacillus milii]MCF6419493.1 type II toxin-antitoxin system YoeB family toxin [Furfurilactobacillus milii]
MDKENQIVYSVTGTAITIFQLKYHY